MKSNQELLDYYLDRYNILKEKNELWRLRVSPQKYLSELEKIRAYGIQARATGQLTECNIQSNQDGMLGILLMDKMTYAEVKDQFERSKKQQEKCFAEEAPRIQAVVKKYKTSLSNAQCRRIHTWLVRRQIDLAKLNKEVQTEFKRSRFYENYRKRHS